MDETRFNALARAVRESASRRRLLRFLSALPLTGGLAAGFDTEAGHARKRRKHKKKCKSKAKVCQGRSGRVTYKCHGRKKTANCGSGCDVCATDCPFTSIQDAIDAADAGATIRVCAGTYGGSIQIDKDLTLHGAGDGDNGTILDGQGMGQVVSILESATVDMQALRITGGNTSGIGAGISNLGMLTVTACTVTGNTADPAVGGGVANGSGATLAMIDCTISENSALISGGGFTNSGTLTLTGCTVSGNSAGRGGGISNGGTLTLTDCVMSENTANLGGGINNAGVATLTDCTVSGNTANIEDGGGGILNDGGSSVCTGDSNVSGNTNGNCTPINGGDCDNCSTGF